MPSASPTGRPFFSSMLPTEICEKIYIEVFKPFPALLLQRDAPRKHNPNIIHCAGPIGQRRRGNTAINWRRSNTGILLTSKQCYNEAAKCLYSNISVIFDKPFSINYAFLRHVTRPTLACIKHITIQHTTTCLDGRAITRQRITQNEVSETAMWARIASSMTGLHTLKIKLEVLEYYDHIVPPFDHDRGSDDPNTFFSVDKLNAIHWLQPLKAFCALGPRLKRARVDIWDEPQQHMRAFTFNSYKYHEVVHQLSGQTYEAAQDEVCGKWCCFMKALYGSMGRAIRDIILGRDEPWAEHLVMLTKYQMFRADQHGSTGLFKSEEDEARAVQKEMS